MGEDRSPLEVRLRRNFIAFQPRTNLNPSTKQEDELIIESVNLRHLLNRPMRRKMFLASEDAIIIKKVQSYLFRSTNVDWTRIASKLVDRTAKFAETIGKTFCNTM
ncbi:hypothetical protein EON65_02735 [archaeon]|nr:MAG: hypothetical protein EON65_02735 [archaeon]